VVEVKKFDKDLLVVFSELLLIVAYIVVGFKIIVFDYPIEDLVPLSISVLFSVIYLYASEKPEEYFEEDIEEKGKSAFKVAVCCMVCGYLCIALTLFVSQKVTEVTSSDVKEVNAVVNIDKDKGNVLLSIDGSLEGIKNVTNSDRFSIGDKVTSISYEDQVIHFKSWVGLTEDKKRKETILKGQ
jgi:hypothetical protein